MYLLAGCRAVRGPGAGGLFSLAPAIVADVVPARDRPRYQGNLLAVFGMSSVLGPVIGGFFAGAAGSSAVLARPFQSGFSDAMDQIFPFAALPLVVAFVLFMLLPPVELRAQSAMAAREAAATPPPATASASMPAPTTAPASACRPAPTTVSPPAPTTAFTPAPTTAFTPAVSGHAEPTALAAAARRSPLRPGRPRRVHCLHTRSR